MLFGHMYIELVRCHLGIMSCNEEKVYSVCRIFLYLKPMDPRPNLQHCVLWQFLTWRRVQPLEPCQEPLLLKHFLSHFPVWISVPLDSID